MAMILYLHAKQKGGQCNPWSWLHVKTRQAQFGSKDLTKTMPQKAGLGKSCTGTCLLCSRFHASSTMCSCR